MDGGRPVLQTDRYIIDHIELTGVKTIGGDWFKAQADEVIYSNQGYAAEQLSVAERMGDVTRIWSRADQLPTELRTLVIRHRDLVTADGPIPRAAERVVDSLQRGLARSAADLDIAYVESTDVVPGLLSAFGLPIASYLVDPAEVDPEQIEVRRREIVRWRKTIQLRGPEAVRFRRSVRAAYRNACVICGLRFPSTELNAMPGIEAAHILPWAEYERDTVDNGIALCKQHHWAFDESLLTIIFDDGQYHVKVHPGIDRLDANVFSVEHLQAFAGPIPDDRLPHRASDRPKPQFLQTLADLLEPTL